MLFLNAGQARSFLLAAREDGDMLEAVYALALATGIRRSEILGLQHEDLDLPALTLSIRRGLTAAPGGGITLDEPKRPSSKRLLDLPESAWPPARAGRARASSSLPAPVDPSTPAPSTTITSSPARPYAPVVTKSVTRGS